jgi:hypothetical protein
MEIVSELSNSTKRGRGRPPIPRPDVERLRQIFAVDPRAEAIGAALGVGTRTARRWLVDAGLARRWAQRPRNVKPAFVRIAKLPGGRRVSCRLYNSFDAMHKRCFGKNKPEFHLYGGRGIRICAEWLHNYPAFRSWALANGYRKGLTLDRIDGNGNYEPSNCRWATRQEQTYNTSRVHRLTLNGVTKLLPIWARELGVSMEMLRQRRAKGWPDHDILTVPKGGHRNA